MSPRNFNFCLVLAHFPYISCPKRLLSMTQRPSKRPSTFIPDDCPTFTFSELNSSILDLNDRLFSLEDIQDDRSHSFSIDSLSWILHTHGPPDLIRDLQIRLELDIDGRFHSSLARADYYMLVLRFLTRFLTV